MDSCEYGNESSGFVKENEFLDQIRDIRGYELSTRVLLHGVLYIFVTSGHLINRQ
jgi:hypothetical protein